MDAEELVDIGRYPLHRHGSEAHSALLTRVGEALGQDGCAVVRGFVRPACIPLLVAQCDAAAPNAHRSHGRTNPYFNADDPSLPQGHPRRRFSERSNAFIPADNFQRGCALRAIYKWPHFAPFIQAVLGEARFHPYADPLADVIVNMAGEGNGFPWHFDTNNYTVTLAIQNAEVGGEFEYVPDIRRHDENFDTVRAVLDGDRSLVKVLRLQPGDLQIFKGRYSLHRVTPLRGATPRYVGIFSYAEQPGIVATPKRCLELYGKVLPIHYRQADERPDRLLD